MSLALATDFRIMSSSARLVEAFIALALVPDSGASFFTVRALGYARAFAFATLNKPISAEEALQLGLVNLVVSPEAFPATVQTFAELYAEDPRARTATSSCFCSAPNTLPWRSCLSWKPNTSNAPGRARTMPKGSARSWRSARRTSVDSNQRLR
jgi:enoyl-CoA hydratase/carnithine racemase